MTLTVDLPEKVEQAYIAAARTKGVSVSSLVVDLLVSHAPCTELPLRPELTLERGIPVLYTGRPIDPLIVADTIEMIQRERELRALGPQS